MFTKNPYKQIERLERRIAKLESENARLSAVAKDCERIKAECEVKEAATEKVRLEYAKMLQDLQKSQAEYKDLIKLLRTKVKEVNGTYRKAFNDIKERR